MRVGLCRRKEIKHIDLLMLRTDTINTSNTLHDARRIPWQIIVDKYVGAMEIDALCQDIRRNQDIIEVMLPICVFRIEAILDICLLLCAALSRVCNHACTILCFQFFGQIFCRFTGLGKDDFLLPT